MLSQQVETKSRLLAKLLREVLATGSYDTLADLADALKRLCNRHRIRYTPEDMSSAFQWVGSNHPLVDEPPAAVEHSAPSASRPLTARESSRLYRQIVERYTAGLPAVPPEAVAPEIDGELAARLSALDEPVALHYFWHHDGDRLALLLLFTAVTITRPGDWDPRTIRRAYDESERANDPAPCFGCLRADGLSGHHVIAIDHGGSNARRNVVPLCFECHRYLHPWLTTLDTPRRLAHGFESIGHIAGRLV